MLAARWIFSENVDKMRLFDPLEPFILIFVGSQQQQSVQHCLRRSVLGVAHWPALPATQPQSVTLIFSVGLAQWSSPVQPARLVVAQRLAAKTERRNKSPIKPLLPANKKNPAVGK
jgi:hypothetical protein